MAVKFRKQAIKFLQRANSEEVAKIQGLIRQLVVTVEEQGIIPFNDLDIKKMKGEWEGFYRLRVGKNRVLFTVRIDSGEVEIYTIGARGQWFRVMSKKKHCNICRMELVVKDKL